MALPKRGIAPLAPDDAWEKTTAPTTPWVDGRSAKEAARVWLERDGTKPPAEVSAALAGHKDFGPVQAWRAEAGTWLPFDDFAEVTRASDVVVHARDAHGPFLIAVEAKADEPGGETVDEALAVAVDRLLENNRSHGLARIEQLAAALVGPRQTGDPSLRDVRYQLLTACAGALCEAGRRGYRRTLMLIHEFGIDKTSADRHERNAADLNTFVKRLSHRAVTDVRRGAIEGPFTVPGAPLISAKVDLFLGRVCRSL